MSSVYVPKALRARVLASSKARCGYCLSRQDIMGAKLEIDHIFPDSLGGATVEGNLCMACSLCNEHKGNRITAEDPTTGRQARLFNPRQDDWWSHFIWTESGEYIEGKTAIGRGTVNGLHLNRRILVTARRFWIIAGWHPPKD